MDTEKLKQKQIAAKPKDPRLIVETPCGKLLGAEKVADLYGTKYYAFLGIPYATPPIGNLRFLPPEPMGSWKGIRNATAPGPDCCHRSGKHRELQVGMEDCLYLNVCTLEKVEALEFLRHRYNMILEFLKRMNNLTYLNLEMIMHLESPSPAVNHVPCEVQTLKPVIVLVHCGGHGWGSGSPEYFGGPDFVIHNDVIWVSFNYRLHALGFLNLELPGCAGNMAMKDQVMAFRWIKGNIKFFGGDPDNITLYGASSGASDVHLHTISPLSRGLFHKTIRQGGYSLNPIWSYQTDHIERARDLAEQLGFKEKNHRRMLRFLKTCTAEEIAEAVVTVAYNMKKKIASRPFHGIFHPTIEIYDEGAFLPRSPRDLMYSLENEPLPLLCGVTELEGLLAFTGNPYKTNLSSIIKDNLWTYKMNSSTLQTITEKVRSFYFDDQDLTDDMTVRLSELYSDMWYIEWNNMLNFESTRSGACPVYLYLFTYFGVSSYLRKYYLNGKIKNVPAVSSHGDDAGYFTYYKQINQSLKIDMNYQESDRRMIDDLSMLLTTFAKTGNPNTNKLPTELDWLPYRPDDPNYLVFGDELVMSRGVVQEERMQFWNEMLEFIKQNEDETDNLKFEINEA